MTRAVLRTRHGRVALGVLGALAVAIAVVVPLGVSGRLPFALEPTAGRPVAVLDDVVGPSTGPACPLDDRYVDEQPEGLRPDVLDAWRRLRASAGTQGVRLCLNDGKRSAEQQRQEFADALRRFGSREMAEKYVLPPEKSMHVKGIAVDVQPFAAAEWVARDGPALGWCRRYENEYWHFEYDRDYASAGCPELLPSATTS